MFDFNFCRFEFKNLEPTPDQREICNRELELLQDVAPYNSRLNARVEKMAFGCWATVEVRSPFRTFRGKEFAGNAVDAATAAVATVRRRIEEWKRGRGPMAPGSPSQELHFSQPALT